MINLFYYISDFSFFGIPINEIPTILFDTPSYIHKVFLIFHCFIIFFLFLAYQLSQYIFTLIMASFTGCTHISHWRTFIMSFIRRFVPVFIMALAFLLAPAIGHCTGVTLPALDVEWGDYVAAIVPKLASGVAAFAGLAVVIWLAPFGWKFAKRFLGR